MVDLIFIVILWSILFGIRRRAEADGQRNISWYYDRNITKLNFVEPDTFSARL